MDDRSNLTARLALMERSFGAEAHLAFDYYSSSEACDNQALTYSYAYAANDSKHHGFNHDSARVTVKKDGSVTLARATCAKHVFKCERDVQQFVVSRDRSCTTPASFKTDAGIRSTRLPILGDLCMMQRSPPSLSDVLRQLDFLC
jgi:hypothetical protein